MLMQRTFECQTASLLVRDSRGVTHDTQATVRSEDHRLWHVNNASGI